MKKQAIVPARRQEESQIVVPEYLRPKGTPRGGEEVDASDLKRPRLSICQSGSPYRKAATDKYIPGLEEGEWFNTNGIRYGERVYFIPIFLFKSNRHFRPFDEGGGTICMAEDGKHGTACDCGCNNVCLKCQYGPVLGWRDEKGKRVPPECTEFKNYAGIVVPETGLPKLDDAVVLSMKKTSINTSRDWSTKLNNSGMDWWARIWTLETVETSNERKQTWYVPTPPRLYDGKQPLSVSASKAEPYFVNAAMYEIGAQIHERMTQLRATGKLKVEMEDLEQAEVDEDATFDPDKIERAERARR